MAHLFSDTIGFVAWLLNGLGLICTITLWLSRSKIADVNGLAANIPVIMAVLLQVFFYNFSLFIIVLEF